MMLYTFTMMKEQTIERLYQNQLVGEAMIKSVIDFLDSGKDLALLKMENVNEGTVKGNTAKD